MRKVCNQAWCLEAKTNPRFIFLTGDLGFMALEDLRDVAGNRFINAGVAEQNMVSVAAGLAKTGLRPWVYSIAPFCYARPFEQIRNDVALPGLPVQLVGNGGGFSYGLMGPTHHALEDYGVLCTLPHLRTLVPAFPQDLEYLIPRLAQADEPHYLRLGHVEAPPPLASPPPYKAWRQLTSGPGPLVLGIGPLVNPVWQHIETLAWEKRPELWVVSELPLSRCPPPEAWKAALLHKKALLVFEEHVAQGGLGMMIATWLLHNLPGLRLAFQACAVEGYQSGLYGSQAFHRQENNLDPLALSQAWTRLAGLTS